MNFRSLSRALALITTVAVVAPLRAQELWPDLSRPAAAVGGGEQDAGVVVGIEAYGFVPSVPGAEPNAKAWYDYLTRTRGAAPANVKLLLGLDATREDMLEAAQAAASKAGPQGTLWFVFVGHGAPSADGKDGLLVGVDAQQKAGSLQKRSLRSQEILAALAKSRAGSISVILDACFSGRGQDGASIAPGLQPLVTVAVVGSADPRIVVLTAAKGDQFAGALPGANRPAFSYLTLGALRGWAAGKDGRVTAGGVWRYATSALEATLRGRNQTPNLMGKEGAVVGMSAGEKGPDLAALAKATAGGAGHDFRASNRPASPRAKAPKILDSEATATSGAGKAGIHWVQIPGGSFMMGSDGGEVNEKPVHQVTVKSFSMAKTEVTNKQYKACVDSGVCTAPSSYMGGNDHPVVKIDWYQALAFSQWVGGRLPSESEWEYAARSAGKDYMYPWGNEAATCDRAVISDCGGAASVCSKPEGNTAQGLCDMAGNVLEWTRDWHHVSYEGAPTDGSAWERPAGSHRILRSGAWFFGASSARAASRSRGQPSYGANSDDSIGYIGFRPAR